MKGTVVSIHITSQAAAPMQAVPQARAVPGRGLEGDRYFAKTGTYSDRPGTGRELTLVESETVEALEREYGVKLSPGETRRNITTRGVAVNHLVDREFRVGEVRLRGVRLCEPCAHLQSLTHEKVLPGLVHRGGLRCDILTEGVIRAGDTIEPL
ncbi:MAG: MOSC domain-containing protein [Dehalococcoidia bacterium]|nr:MOSC domain-containing protein [Dehalococcoidia bacterium]